MGDEFRSRLREARLNRMLTQRELSEEAGFSKNLVARLESVDRGKAPRISTVRKLAAVLGVNARWLYDGTGEMLAGEREAG